MLQNIEIRYTFCNRLFIDAHIGRALAVSIFVSIYENQNGFFEKKIDSQAAIFSPRKSPQSTGNKGKSRNLKDCGIFLVVAEKEGFEPTGKTLKLLISCGFPGFISTFISIFEIFYKFVLAFQPVGLGYMRINLLHRGVIRPSPKLHHFALWNAEVVT